MAHEAVPPRFDRYIATAGYNTDINRRQFGIDRLEWPTDYRYPDETYRDALTLEVGGVRFGAFGQGEQLREVGERWDAPFLNGLERPVVAAEAADFDAELDAVRSQVLADPRVTADVVKLWMRA